MAASSRAEPRTSEAPTTSATSAACFSISCPPRTHNSAQFFNLSPDDETLDTEVRTIKPRRIDFDNLMPNQLTTDILPETTNAAASHEPALSSRMAPTHPLPAKCPPPEEP